LSFQNTFLSSLIRTQTTKPWSVPEGSPREIERYLKDLGVLELTDKEKLEKELDRAFPDAQSKEVVEYNGKKYMRRFFPIEKSRSRKTVKEWGKSWEPVKE
jgi:hypothetical protein